MKNITSENGAAANSAMRQHQRHRPFAMRVVGGKGANEAIGVHSHCFRSLAVRLASPRCSATRTAPSLIDSFAAVALIDALSTAIDCSTSRWRAGKRFEMHCYFPRRHGFLRRLARNDFGKIVDVDEHPAAATAQRIDQLVARDREQPRRERRIGVPGMPLQMYRQQNILHDVLGLIDRLTCPRKPTPRHRPQHRSDGAEQALIRGTVP